MSELISGKEAKVAWAEGVTVQVATGADQFRTLVSSDDLGIFDRGNYFRLKPRTITINGIESPAPFEPKEGERYLTKGNDMSKRTSVYGVMYDDKQSKAYLDKIVNNIKAEVEFNILTGGVLPFKIYEKIPPNMPSNGTTYITKELSACGVILNLSEMIVEELL